MQITKSEPEVRGDFPHLGFDCFMLSVLQGSPRHKEASMFIEKKNAVGTIITTENPLLLENSVCVCKHTRVGSIVEMQNKQQCDTASLLSEWPKSRALTAPSAGTDVEQEEHSFLVSGKTKRRRHVKGQFLTQPNLL